jgi:hypothetical protein
MACNFSWLGIRMWLQWGLGMIGTRMVRLGRMRTRIQWLRIGND